MVLLCALRGTNKAGWFSLGLMIFGCCVVFLFGDVLILFVFYTKFVKNKIDKKYFVIKIMFCLYRFYLIFLCCVKTWQGGGFL